MSRQLDNQILHEQMEDNSTEAQTMYELSIPANTIAAGNRLKVNLTLGRVFETPENCPDTLDACPECEGDGAFEDASSASVFSGCPTAGMDGFSEVGEFPSSGDADMEQVFVTSGSGKYGYKGLRLCCPPDYCDQFGWDGQKYGVFGTEFYPFWNATYDEVPCEFPSMMAKYTRHEGQPITGLAFGTLTSTKDNFTGYACIINEIENVVYIYRYLNQPLSSTGTVITSAPKPSPFNELYVFFRAWPYNAKVSGAGTEDYWYFLASVFYGDDIGVDNELIHVDHDSLPPEEQERAIDAKDFGYEGVLMCYVALGIGEEGTALWEDLQAECGLCYATGGADTPRWDTTCTMYWTNHVYDNCEGQGIGPDLNEDE